MNKPNIFNCATREMSQEAFIFWLFGWSNSDAMTINPELHNLSRKLLEAFLSKHGKTLPLRIKKIKIIGGFYNIDIILEINDSIVIPIPDKIYNRESPDQLLQYIQILKEDGYSEQNILPIYLQTGAQGNYEKLKRIGYSTFSRKELLDILNKGKVINNDILRDYIEYIKEFENITQSFMHLHLNQWHLYSWEGFYNYLQAKLGDGEWDAVSSPHKTFLGFWWHWHSDNDCEKYLQLEKSDLCFKIKVRDKKKRRDLRLKWSERFIKEAEGNPIKVVKPTYQNDNAITVAVVDADYRQADKKGMIDLDKTLDVIIEVQKIFDKAINV